MTTLTLVTGAAGAVGEAVVTHLRRLGHPVAALDRPGTEQRLESLAPRAHDYVTVTSEHSVAALRESFDLVEGRLGPIHSAVLLAGNWQGGKRLHEESSEVWRAMLDNNLETARCTLSALLPAMVRRRHGSIVLLGSRAAVRPWESVNAAAYAAAKAAVVALAQTVAAEVVHDGVRVNVVLPSTIDTPANRAAMPDADAERWVSPEGLCEVIQFLLSERARDVTGAVIPVYGRV